MSIRFSSGGGSGCRRQPRPQHILAGGQGYAAVGSSVSIKTSGRRRVS